MSQEQRAAITPSLEALEDLADSFVDGRKTRLQSKDPYFIAAFICLCSWVFVVEIRSPSAIDVEAAKEFHSIVPRWLHMAGCSCLYAALFTHVLQIFTEVDPFRRTLLVLVAHINGVSGTFYALMYYELVPIMRGWNGMMLVPLRFLHWNMTAPIMIYIVSHLSQLPSSRILNMVLLTVACLVTGLLASLPFPSLLPPGPQESLRWSLMAISCITFFIVIYEVHSIFASARAHIRSFEISTQEGARQRQIQDHTVRCLIAQETFFLLAWHFIPVTYFLSLFNLVPLAEIELLYCIGDILAKVLYSNVALSSNYLALDASLQLSRMAEMEMIAKKEAFIGRVSHELRTPLNGIIGLSENMVMNPGTLDAKQVKFLSTIRNSGLQLLHLINNILDTAAYKTGEITIQRQKVNLEEVVSTAVDMYVGQMRPEVSLTAEINGPLPTIIGDSMRIARILNILISNAVKFTVRGGIVVRAEEMRGGMVKLEVQDTGVGIPPNLISSIFDSGPGGGGGHHRNTALGAAHRSHPGGPGPTGAPGGARSDAQDAASAAGIRLGLSMTKRLVEAHGGTIVVASEVGVGSTFTVMLPVGHPND